MIKENFIKLYENSFRENWDLPCYTDYGEDTQYTYGEVAEKIARLHLLFKHCSLRRGDKISVIGKNNAHWCIAYMATITYGAIIVPILQDFTPQRCSSYRQSFRICISVHQRQHLGQSGRGKISRITRRILTDRFPVVFISVTEKPYRSF